MPKINTNETRVNIEETASISSEIDSQNLIIAGSNEEMDPSVVRWNALKALPFNLIVVVLLLGGNESISIYLENLEVTSDVHQPLLWYIKKGYTLGLATSVIELAKDFTALRYVDKIIENLKELVTGKTEKTLEEIISETAVEKLLQFGNLVNSFIVKNNQKSEDNYEQRFQYLELKYKENLKKIDELKNQLINLEQVQQKQEQKIINSKVIMTKQKNKRKQKRKKVTTLNSAQI